MAPLCKYSWFVPAMKSLYSSVRHLSLLLGCRDTETGKYLTCGMMGTGIKEKEGEGITFEELTKMLKPHIIAEKGREVSIRPSVVLEIAYEEIQKSPTYASGYALRFPRVVRDRTMERGPKDCSDIEYVKILFKQQRK